MTKQTYALFKGFIIIFMVFLSGQANLILAQCNENLPNYSRLGTYGSSVYYLSNSPAQPIVAESAAIALGGHLVDINTQGENDFIQSMIDEMTYIGLNDSNSEGNLRWTSNAAVTFTNFDNCVFCNPNDAENDYAMIHPWNGGWSFMNRWNPRRYIVELACSDTGSGGGNGGGSSMDDCVTAINGFNFIGKQGDSNYFLSSNSATWTNANNTAQTQGGSLVVIDDAAENQFLAGKFDEMVYIGLNDASNEGQLSWADGSTLGYENFEDNCGFCNENDAENDFAIIHPWNAKWSFTNQWSQRRYIMEIGCDEGGTSLSYNNCPQDRTIQLQQGQSSAFVNWTAPDLFNNCDAGVGSNTQTAGPNNGTSLSEGDYTVSYRGTNNCGDIATCSFNIRVLEVANPTGNSTLSFRNCPTDRVLTIVDGENTAFVNWTPPSVSSSCNAGGLSLGLISGPNNGSNLTAGAYNIRYRASNNCGDIAMCSFTITVMKSDSPSSLSIDCSPNFNIQVSEGSTTTALSFATPTVNNVCDNGGTNLQQTSGPTRNSQVGAGSYMIQYRATNNCGDVAICEFNINVTQETIDPPSSLSLDCTLNVFVEIPFGATTTALAYDLPVINNVCSIPGVELTQTQGQENERNSQVIAGTYVNQYLAKNNCNDFAQCPIVVHVSNETGITISNCPSDPLIFDIPFPATEAVLTWPIPSFVNLCLNSNMGIEQIQGPNPGTAVSAGTYTVVYRASNGCGDSDECAFDIIVNQGNGPTSSGGNVNYTANDQVTPYTGLFRPGTNIGYNPPWTDEEMANLAAGNPTLGVKGIGARSMRPGLFGFITDQFGYDFRLQTYAHYASLGLDDLTMIVGFPPNDERDQTDYCGNGVQSELYANLYTDIWDDGANGTPYNDDNFYAAYIYNVVSRYGPYVKFWEIWNEPGNDGGLLGWRQPGDPVGNWWDNDPNPCDYILHAPIEHYIRTLRISYEVIKTLQPDDYVTVAGVGYISFLDAILRNTDNPAGGDVSAEYPLSGGAYFDVMGFHSYPDIDGSVYSDETGQRVYMRNSDTAAQGINNTQDSYQGILDNYGYSGAPYPEKEWIITEINVPRVPFREVAMTGGPEMRVNYIIKAVAVAMQNDVTQMHVYNLGDEETEANATEEFDLYGMHKRLTGTNPYTQVRNLQAIAYKSAADFVWGSRYDAARTAQMNLSNNVDGVALRLENGRYKYIIWAKTTIDQSEFASASYTFPASFGYGQVFRRTWNFTDTDQVNGISSNNIALSGRPIFITETANTSELVQRRAEDSKYHLSIADIVPNPAVDEVKLVLESDVADNYNIQIYNITGQLIEERKTFLERGLNEQRFNISDYVPGMYFVMIEGALMRSTKVKFVKAE